MKTAVLQRVKSFMEVSNIKSAEGLAKAIGANPQTVRQYFKGERSISIDFVLQLINSFEMLSTEWLLRGRGPMCHGETTSNNYTIKGTDNSVNISGDSQGDITTNAVNNDKEIINKLLEQNQQLINILAKR